LSFSVSFMFFQQDLLPVLHDIYMAGHS